jgi:NAD-dependent deacetylase
MLFCKSPMLNSVNFLKRKDEIEDLYTSLRGQRDITKGIVDQIQDAKFRVAITGAGISSASGLPLLGDDVGGIELREFFDGSIYHQDKKQFYDSYRKILRMFVQARPNPAHTALAASHVSVITQNIDGLHRIAGSERLLEIHGNIRELRCMNCGLVESSMRALHYSVPRCPNCNQILHPGITLTGEEVRHVSRATDWAGRADLILIVGTELSAQPVAKLPDAARQGTPIIEINQNAEVLLPMLLQQEHA